MPEFKVTATVTLVTVTEVEAEDLDDAHDTVDGWDFSDFDFDTNVDADEIDWEITEKK